MKVPVINDENYTMLLSYMSDPISFKNKTSFWRIQCGSYFATWNENSKKVYWYIRNRVLKRAYKTAIPSTDEWLEISSLYSNPEPNIVIVAKHCAKIVISDIMMEEITWKYALLNGRRTQDSNFDTVYVIYERFPNVFVVSKIINNAATILETIKNERLADIRKEYFLCKSYNSHWLKNLYSSRQKLINKYWNPDQSTFNIGEEDFSNHMLIRRWSCQTRFSLINRRILIWRNYVVCRNYKSIMNSLRHIRFDFHGKIDNEIVVSSICKLGVFVLMNTESTKFDDSIEKWRKIYTWLDFCVKFTTRINAWRMFGEIFSMNLCLDRISEAEEMSSLLAHKRLRRGQHSNVRKLFELYLALADHQRFSEAAVEGVTFFNTLQRAAKTVDILLHYGPELIEIGRLAAVCNMILATSSDDGNGTSCLDIFHTLNEHLMKNTSDTSAFVTFLACYPDEPLIEELITNHCSDSVILPWCRQRFKEDHSADYNLLVTLLINHLDYNSNRNSKKVWKMLDILLEQQLDAEIITKLWQDRSDWWELYHLPIRERNTHLYSLKENVIEKLKHILKEPKIISYQWK